MFKILISILLIAMVFPTTAYADCNSTAATAEDLRQLNNIIQRGLAIEKEQQANIRRAWMRNIRLQITTNAGFHKAGCPANGKFSVKVYNKDKKEAAERFLNIVSTVYGDRNGILTETEIDQMMDFSTTRILIWAAGWR